MKNVLLVLLSVALLLCGFLAFGFAFSAPAGQAFIFFGGIVLVAVAFSIPLSVLGLRRSHRELSGPRTTDAAELDKL